MRSLPDTYQMCEVTSLRACSVKVAPNRLEMDEAEEGSTEERSLSPPGSFKKMQSSLRESVATAASRLLHSNGLLHSKDQPQKKSMSVPESMTKKKRRSVIDLPNRLSFYSFEEKKRREAELEEQKAARPRFKRSGTLARFTDSTAHLFFKKGTVPRSASAAAAIAKRLKHEKLGWRERAFLILEEPSSSTTAQILSIAVRLATLLAMLSSILESIPDFVDRTGRQPFLAANVRKGSARSTAHPTPRSSLASNAATKIPSHYLIMPAIWTQFDLLLQIHVRQVVFFLLFTVEAFIRVVAYIPFHMCYRDPFIWLDILTVVPFLIRLLSTAFRGDPLITDNLSQGQRVLEALGSIRLLKLCRYDEGASLLARAIFRSMGQLYVSHLSRHSAVCSALACN